MKLSGWLRKDCCIIAQQILHYRKHLKNLAVCLVCRPSFVGTHSLLSTSVKSEGLKKITVSIRNQRAATLSSFQRVIEDNIYISMNSTDSSKADSTVAHFFHELRRLGLFPMYEGTPESTISRVTAKLSRFQDCSKETDCYCKSHKFNAKFRVVIDQRGTVEHGLCLKCVTQGKFLSKDGNRMALIQAECDTSRAAISVPCSCNQRD